MPAFSITAAHLVMSLFMRSVMASGVLPRISMPSLVTFSWISGLGRTSYLPAVPTVQESGIKDFEVVSWNGVSVPAATPKAYSGSS